MTYPRIGNEIDNIGATEMETAYRAHSWRCCWTRTIRQVGRTFTALVIVAGLILIARLTFIIHGKIDANIWATKKLLCAKNNQFTAGMGREQIELIKTP